MPPYRVGFLRRFGLKTGIWRFAYLGLESGMGFEGTTGAYERTYRFSSKLVRKKEEYANSNSNFVELFDEGVQSHNTVYALHRFMLAIY